ncbi:DUF6364 family protein [Stenomitos frigidus]|uniref:CopG family transcriptional regulator n=1 Tax=Stenomitos frigidus ULC18 TaxID=2107698 RepID=A0A2T1DXG2_9CYAN|nr:DUF6364 family protein [Stenomitos frigidus]PSB25175.1 hypothetical protein C7B82_24225 [Stenomitos frigidus ULC18]
METELTLHLDDRLVKKADRWAKSHNLSLSDAVAALLKQLPDPDQPLDLSPWTQQLVGVLAAEGAVDTNEASQAQYLDYLEEKYQ